MTEHETETKLKVPHSKLENDVMACLQALSKEEGINLTTEQLRSYSHQAVNAISSDINSSVYTGLILVGMELASKMVEEDYKLEQK